MRRSVPALATALALLAAAGPADAVTDTRRARVAARYIVRNQADNGSFAGLSAVGTTADGVVALVAARRGPGAITDALAYLRRKVRSGAADNIGLKAKVVMAAVAGGADPRRFAGRNLVRRIRRSEAPDGRYGVATYLFNHALAMLALRAADAQVSQAASDWLVTAQCDDGGWQFDEPAGENDTEHCIGPQPENDFFTSDSNTTALAVQALAATPADEQPAVDPLSYFPFARDDVKGGWGYNHQFTTTDANSTALVLQAFAAVGTEPPAGGRRALRRLQYRLCGKRAGAFASTWDLEDGRRTPPDLAATVAAVPGLLEMPFPVPYLAVTKRAPRPGPCP